MTKNAKKHVVEQAPVAEITAKFSHDWGAPITADSPCGPDLEYDPECAVVLAKALVRTDAQYGDFVGSAEPINWSDVDRDCRRLMLRSKDIRLAVLFARCRTRLAGAAGLAQALGLLATWLASYPDAIHPQLTVDADRDVALEIRANALHALIDTDGLLADLREIVLTKSTAARLQVRDVERAFAQPRPVDALAPASVARQLDELREHNPGILTGFSQACASLQAIDVWCSAHLTSFSPDFSALLKLLRLLARSIDASTDAAPAINQFDAGGGGDVQQEFVPSLSLESGPAPAPASGLDRSNNGAVQSMQAASLSRTAPTDRHSALEMIRQARLWFETHEPSSPIPVLLKRSEQFVGRRYAELAHAIPAELLAQWDASE
jgi:type VI secretion system protein ImpA